MRAFAVLLVVSGVSLAQGVPECPRPKVWSNLLQQCVGGTGRGYDLEGPKAEEPKPQAPAAKELAPGALRGHFFMGPSVITAGGLGAALGRETSVFGLTDLMSLAVDTGGAFYVVPFENLPFPWVFFMTLSAAPALVFHVVPEVFEASVRVGPALGLWLDRSEYDYSLLKISHQAYFEVGARARVKGRTGSAWFEVDFSLLMNPYSAVLPRIALGVAL